MKIPTTATISEYYKYTPGVNIKKYFNIDNPKIENVIKLWRELSVVHKYKEANELELYIKEYYEKQDSNYIVDLCEIAYCCGQLDYDTFQSKEEAYRFYIYAYIERKKSEYAIFSEFIDRNGLQKMIDIFNK